MNINLVENGLTKVSDIEIPEKFFNRIKSEIDSIDIMFGGEGLLPGSSFTLSATPGCGKTTLMLQVLNEYAKLGYKVGYNSAEECREQLAFTCQRIGVTEVAIANKTEIHDIIEMAAEANLDILMIDSIQGIRVDKDKVEGGVDGSFTTKKQENYISNIITNAAPQINCVIGCILHVTKSGEYKGSTQLPHSVDANFKMEVDPTDDTIRTFGASKNRFGGCSEVQFYMNSNGLDLNSDIKATRKGNSKLALLETLNQIALKQDDEISTRQFTNFAGGSYTKGQELIRQLMEEKMIEQTGRGKYKRLAESGTQIADPSAELDFTEDDFAEFEDIA